MLTLLADQPECLWDDVLPVEVKELPGDLAALDGLLSDHELLWPLVERWRREFEQTGRAVLTEGRPTIALETYVRLMVLKQRYRWGYRTLQAEVSDSIHLRRFCRISLTERVPDESTVRKLTRRIGAETVSELTRAMIAKATREKRFRPRAVRIDSTVIEADVKYPTDAGLASAGARTLAREGRKLAKLLGEGKRRVRDRSRSLGGKLRAISRTIRRRSGEAKEEVLKLTAETGELLQRSLREARRLAAIARRKARGRGARAKLEAAAGRAGGSVREGRPADQAAGGGRADHRSDRVAVRPGRPADPQGQVGQAERVRVRQPAGGGDREHQARRQGPDLAGVDHAREPEREHAAARHRRRARAGRDLSPEVALDGGFMSGPTNTALEDLTPKQVFIAGRQEPASKRTARRLRRYRTGAEGRISHLKRRYGLDRSRLKGDEGQRIWTEWAILSYNSDTLAIRTR